MSKYGNDKRKKSGEELFRSSSVYRKSRERKAKKRKKLVLRAILAAAAIAACIIAELNYQLFSDIMDSAVRRQSGGAYYVLPAVGDGELHISFLDVGQGDSTLIRFPDGKNMIIDGGPRSAKDSVLGILNAAGIDEIEYLLLTHPDEDHVGSLDDVLYAAEVKNIYMPDSRKNTKVYMDFIDAVEQEREHGAQVFISEAGMVIEGESYMLTFFTPLYSMYQNTSYNNELSPIIYLEYAGKKAVFTGDATKVTEDIFLQVLNGTAVTHNYPLNTLSGYAAAADIYKVGHHGSNTSSSESFLLRLRPQISVISSGADNSYGHPHKDVVRRLQTYGVIYNTAVSGTVTAIIASDGGVGTIKIITQYGQTGGSFSGRVIIQAFFVLMRRRSVFLYV